MNDNASSAMKNQNVWRVGIFGTFDVENYGDLLFPIIAQLELSRRLVGVEIVPFSYHEKSSLSWPYNVRSLVEFPHLAGGLDAVLIGGGFIVRFDKFIAPGYQPPVPWIHHPTGYWLTPALIAANHGIPVIWNAPGMHCNELPSWSHSLLSLALKCSSHIAVRDEPSKTALLPFVAPERLHVLPDTAFSIGRYLHSHRASEEAVAVRERLGLHTPYVIIQATQNLERFTDHVKRFRAELPNVSFLLLRLGPVLHDHESFIDADLPRTFKLQDWPSPMVLASLISESEAAVGHSYHLAITALSCGVPVFSSSDLSQGKFTALARFGTVHPLPPLNCDDPQWISKRIGRKQPSNAAVSATDALERYWDQVADIIQRGKTDSAALVNAFWMSLPGMLEQGHELSEHEKSKFVQDLQRMESRMLDSDGALELAKAQLERVEDSSNGLEITLLEIRQSLSWKVTAPLRRVWDWISNLSTSHR